jgi:hypothetical protein
MLTDDEALRLIERVRRRIPSLDVVELCDWALGQIQWRASLDVTRVKADQAKANLDVHVTQSRKDYMRNYMRKKRAKSE